ncbi:hypothetical protein pdam_00012659 [Pocillopora damicornis]|uniref:Uncharacterized protein n=1 Tax=Pocillopora damicornis TaxID=46731 RepID=A0A3M6U129_POCDA|nr:hypothetical protein pdam_00012659 [Pocillopora damicornis]
MMSENGRKSPKLDGTDRNGTIITSKSGRKKTKFSPQDDSTKTWNDPKPPKTTYNLHLKNFNNDLQPPQKHLQPLENYLKLSKTKHKCLK